MPISFSLFDPPEPVPVANAVVGRQSSQPASPNGTVFYKLLRSDIIQRIHLQEKRFGFEPEVTAK